MVPFFNHHPCYNLQSQIADRNTLPNAHSGAAPSVVSQARHQWLLISDYFFCTRPSTLFTYHSSFGPASRLKPEATSLKIRIDIPNFQCKFSEAPKITKSMNQALESLNLAHLWIIHPGEHPYPLSEQISVWPIKDIAVLPKQLR